ncbi:unnamed protein product [Brachionus calyciflorus]|uniref:Tc1-like transposase DDE domain-containing protein n=1 Tax=Brachionus calyciflorus TaxID=104777 RepID=A0A814RFQ4_9BILA|nr:unnamed protein product [Brachionus calyciflorus]
MLSDFIIAEKSFSLFELNDEEWEEALKNEPILNKESQLGFLSKSATSIITPSKDKYFNNESIHEQFSLVDNATTHTKKYVDANMFALNINKSCPVEYLVWNDDKGNHKIDCYFREGPNVNELKGLYVLCKELEIIPKNSKKSSFKLEQLRKLASGHISFKSKSKLEVLVDGFNKKYKMDIRLHFLPKYHCELNPIEQYWAYLKNRFRKFNEQSTNERLIIKLILDSREEYKIINMNSKIVGRFWRVVESYNVGEDYKTVMKKHLKSHRRIGLIDKYDKKSENR